MKLNSLRELGALKALLEQRRLEALSQQARRRDQGPRQQRTATQFATVVGEVIPLKPSSRAEVPRPRPAPWPRQRELDERAALQATMSDEIDVESLLDTDEMLSFRRPDLGPEVVRKLRRGHWAIQRQIDLHGLRRDQARERLAAFMREAERAGLRCVRVVHGKGNGSPGREPVLKGKVRRWLVQRNEVLAFVQARPSEGGRGALIVLLHSRPAQPG